MVRGEINGAFAEHWLAPLYEEDMRLSGPENTGQRVRVWVPEASLDTQCNLGICLVLNFLMCKMKS